MVLLTNQSDKKTFLFRVIPSSWADDDTFILFLCTAGDVLGWIECVLQAPAKVMHG